MSLFQQTRMQIINPSAGGLYTGLSHAVSTIYRIEGIRTLWRGMTSVIVGAGMEAEPILPLETMAVIGDLVLTEYRSGSCGLFRHLRSCQRPCRW